MARIKTPQHEYAFDVPLRAAVRVNASSYAEALEILDKAIGNTEYANLGAFPSGNPVLAEVSLAEDIRHPNNRPYCYELDGEPDPVTCPDCGAIEGDPSWGTVGDGYGGYCPDCADKREAT